MTYNIFNNSHPFNFNADFLKLCSQDGTTLVTNERVTVSQAGAEHTLVFKTTLKSDEGVIKFKSDKGGFELDFNLIVTG